MINGPAEGIRYQRAFRPRPRPEGSNAMLWRHLCLVRAWSAAGLLTCSMLGTAALAEPEIPAPQGETETVDVLAAQKSGDLTLDVRGSGQDRVRMALQNTSAKRLNVVLPPGLVASSLTAQRGGGGGGF